SVRWEAVASEERLDVAARDEPGEVRAGARVYDDGARDHDDPPGPLANPPHLPRDALDGELNTPLARGVGGHEPEGLARVPRVPAVDADAVDAADDQLVAAQVADETARDSRFSRAVLDDEHGVHPLAGGAYPAPVDADVGREDCRAVELRGRDSVLHNGL